MFEIEKNVPMPTHGKGRSMYPFRELEVGDSFFVPCEQKEGNMFVNRLSNAAALHKPNKFTCRRVDGGVRVWRIQ